VYKNHYSKIILIEIISNFPIKNSKGKSISDMNILTAKHL
jgi:hypothetical protein